VGPRILVVDDHPSFRRLAARMLGEGGFTVVGEAEDAASAIREATRLQPDVVLLDVVLPDRSGLLVAAELARAAVAPRVVLTSSRSRADLGASSELPVGCEFVPKHELTAARVRAVLRSE
jgi:DNA-binding NarL/FixJ family response regulator